MIDKFIFITSSYSARMIKILKATIVHYTANKPPLHNMLRAIDRSPGHHRITGRQFIFYRRQTDRCF